MKIKDITPERIFSALNHDYGQDLRPIVLGISALRGAKVPEIVTHRSGSGYGLFRIPSRTFRDKDEEMIENISAILFPYDREKRIYKRLAKPTKSHPLVKPLSRTKVKSISCEEAEVRFNHKEKTITWEVEENNRAVDRAHQQWLWEAVSTALGRVKWTRGSGGNIVGNDEYNRYENSDSEGGGGNYVTHRFGPPKKSKPQRRRA